MTTKFRIYGEGGVGIAALHKYRIIGEEIIRFSGETKRILQGRLLFVYFRSGWIKCAVNGIMIIIVGKEECIAWVARGVSAILFESSS